MTTLSVVLSGTPMPDGYSHDPLAGRPGDGETRLRHTVAGAAKARPARAVG
jgi:hypothetical protein